MSTTSRSRVAPIVLAVAVAITAAACAGKPSDEPGPPSKEPASRSNDAANACDPALHRALRSWAEAGFSGSVAVAKGGRFDCLAGYGAADDRAKRPNTAETVFAIGSVTKAFTAAAVLRLVDERKLALTDRIGTVLPELDGPVADATVEQLLRHASGLKGSHGADDQPLDKRAAIAAIGRLGLAFEPGADHLYSNAGYTLLALAVEKVSGTTYRDYVASKVLRLPGGGTAGGFWNGTPRAPGPRAVGYLEEGGTGEPGDFAGPHWGMDGNGGLAMTPRQLATWTRALFTGGLVSARARRALTEPGHPLGDGRSEVPGWVRYDASTYGTPVWMTAGGGGDEGHEVVVAWVPAAERVLVFASNKPKVPAEKLLSIVGPKLLAGQPPPLPDTKGRGAPVGADVAGHYRLDGGGSYDVRVRDGRAVISAAGAPAVTALFPRPRRTSAGTVTAHERRVARLLAGHGAEGREERAGLERSLGEIGRVELAGSLVAGGELRTYVRLHPAGRTVLGWYAVDDAGGVDGAVVPARPPSIRLTHDGDGRYRPDDPTGAGPAVRLTIDGDRLTITGPGGRVTGRRTG